MLSGNVCFLRRACEIMAKQNSSNSNSTDAVRMLLAVEILINPSSITLPAVSSLLAAKKFLSSHSGNAGSRSSNNSNIVDSCASNYTEMEGIMQNTNLSISHEKVEEVKTSGRAKRGREEVESNDDNENDDENEIEDNRDSGVTGDKKRLRKDDVTIPFIVDSSLSAAFGKSNSNSASKVSEKGKEEEDNDDDDDDDDSLPDIDIEANPEK
jgi:hypothetical protein